MANITVRGDQNWNNNHKTFATVRWYHEDELSGDDFHNTFTGAYQHRMTRGSGIDHVWTISPTTVLDLHDEPDPLRRAEQRQRRRLRYRARSASPPTSPRQLSFRRLPRITGLFGDIGIGQAGSVTDTGYYTWAAILTQVKGNMTLKYGAEYWVLQQANKDIGNARPCSISTTQLDPPAGARWRRHGRRLHARVVPPRTSATAALLPAECGCSSGRSTITAFYMQNDWRVTPRLTINLGLRWDFETPVTERLQPHDHGLRSHRREPDERRRAGGLCEDPDRSRQCQQRRHPDPASSSAGQLVQGDGRAALHRRERRAARHLRTPTSDEIQPRVGFAYKLGPNTVIRGGFGRFAQASFNTRRTERLQPHHHPEHDQPTTTSRRTTRSTTLTADGILAPTGAVARAADQSRTGRHLEQSRIRAASTPGSTACTCSTSSRAGCSRSATRTTRPTTSRRA